MIPFLHLSVKGRHYTRLRFVVKRNFQVLVPLRTGVGMISRRRSQESVRSLEKRILILSFPGFHHLRGWSVGTLGSTGTSFMAWFGPVFPEVGE